MSKIRSLIKPMNKRGNIVIIIIFFFLLFVGLLFAFLMVTGSAITNWVFDVAAPELTGLGQVGGVNMTSAAQVTITPVNTFVQKMTWMTGVVYVMILIASVGFALLFRIKPERWLIAFYFLLMIVLIIASILMSNIYEEFYTGTDDLAIRLQEHTILSFMILYSPTIFTFIGFVTGIILFSGLQEEEYV